MMIRRLVVPFPRHVRASSVTERALTAGQGPNGRQKRWLSPSRNLRYATRKPLETKDQTAKVQQSDAAFAMDLDPNSALIFNVRDPTQRSILRSVKLLAKWKDEVANRPDVSEKDRLAIKSMLDKALSIDIPATKRFAALYVTKCALSFPPNGIQAPLAKRAIEIVKQLSLKKDPEAMVLIGQVLEQTSVGSNMSESLFQATQLYENAINLHKEGRWTRAPDKEIIVSPADALYAFGALNYGSTLPSIREKAEEALYRAIKDYNHFEACKYLEGQLGTYSAKHYDCLLRLAVSGYYPAAKAIADICITEMDEFAKYDKTIQEDLLGGQSWTRQAFEDSIRNESFSGDTESIARDGRHWTNPKAAYSFPVSPEEQETEEQETERQVDAVAAWYKRSVNSAPSGGKGKGKGKGKASLTDDEAKKWAKSAFDVVYNYAMRSQTKDLADEKNSEPSLVTDPLRVRYWKALDWYLLAAIGGYVPAMITGCKLAVLSKQLWLVALFDWHIQRVSQRDRSLYAAEFISLGHHEPKIRRLKRDIVDPLHKDDHKFYELGVEKGIIFGYV